MAHSDFFAAEDRALRATFALAVLYVIAIALVIAAADAVVGAVVAFYTMDDWGRSFVYKFFSLLPYTGLAVTAVVVGATLTKAAELRGGGSVFASMLGGRPLHEHVADPAEARLRDVVQEMALAAGVAVPQIFVLDDELRINAFAAGMNNVDPVIGVTAGCLSELNRDELQGIVAHEFSHILHNDTILNTRAYAMIFGLTAISSIGSAMVSAASGDNDDFDNRRGFDIFSLVIGLILVAIGSLGGLAGRTVRAAIARQREYLADAASVQYTRDAESVASALYKMAACGSHLNHSTGEEAEHFLFGPGGYSVWGNFWFTRTHPRISSRIKAVCPGFQPPAAADIAVSALPEDEDGFGVRRSKAQLAENLDAPARKRPEPPASDGRNVIPVKPAAQNLVPSAAVLAKLPEQFRRGDSLALLAPAWCVGLAVADLARPAWSGVLAGLSDVDPARTDDAVRDIKKLSMAPRLALLDSLLPALAGLDSDRKTALFAAVGAIVDIGEQPDIVALAVYWRLFRVLKPEAPDASPQTDRTNIPSAVAVLLGAIVHLQYGSGVLAANAYSRAAQSISRLFILPPLPQMHQTQPADIHRALKLLARSRNDIKDRVAAAAGAIMGSDDIAQAPADLVLRLVCDAAGRDAPGEAGNWM